MKKIEAINALGGTVKAAAKAVNISYQGVNQWPDPLTPAIVDRVVAALLRQGKSAQAKAFSKARQSVAPAKKT